MDDNFALFEGKFKRGEKNGPGKILKTYKEFDKIKKSEYGESYINDFWVDNLNSEEIKLKENINKISNPSSPTRQKQRTDMITNTNSINPDTYEIRVNLLDAQNKLHRKISKQNQSIENKSYYGNCVLF